MSLESDLGRAVLDLSEIVKSETITALARANSEGKLDLTDEDVSVIATIVGASIDASMKNRVDVVTRLARGK